MYIALKYMRTSTYIYQHNLQGSNCWSSIWHTKLASFPCRLDENVKINLLLLFRYLSFPEILFILQALPEYRYSITIIIIWLGHLYSIISALRTVVLNSREWYEQLKHVLFWKSLHYRLYLKCNQNALIMP